MRTLYTATLFALGLVVSSAHAVEDGEISETPAPAAAPAPRAEYLRSCEGWLEAVAAGNPAQFLIAQPTTEAERVQLLADLGIVRSKLFENALRLTLAERGVEITKLNERLRRRARIDEAGRAAWVETFVRHLRHLAAADPSVVAARVRSKSIGDFLAALAESPHAPEYAAALAGEMQKSLHRSVLRLALNRRKADVGDSAFLGLTSGFVTAWMLAFGKYPPGHGFSRLTWLPWSDFHLLHNTLIGFTGTAMGMVLCALVLIPPMSARELDVEATIDEAKAEPISRGVCLIDTPTLPTSRPLGLRDLSERDLGDLDPVEIAYLGHVDLAGLGDDLARNLPGTLSNVGQLLAEIEAKSEILLAAPASRRAQLEFAGAVNEFSALNAGLESEWRETAEHLVHNLEILRTASAELRRRQFANRARDLTETRVIKTEMFLGKLDTDLASLSTARIDPERMHTVVERMKLQVERAHALLDPLPSTADDWTRAAENAKVFVDQTRMELQE